MKLDIRKVLFFGILVIIAILLIFNYRVSILKTSLSEACVNNYQNYLDTNSCPCTSPKKQYFSLNFSELNINMSIKQ